MIRTRGNNLNLVWGKCVEVHGSAEVRLFGPNIGLHGKRVDSVGEE